MGRMSRERGRRVVLDARARPDASVFVFIYTSRQPIKLHGARIAKRTARSRWIPNMTTTQSDQKVTKKCKTLVNFKQLALAPRVCLKE